MDLYHIIAGAPLLLTLVWTLLVYCHTQSQVVILYGQQDRQEREQVNTSMFGCPFMTESVTEDQSLELLAYTVPVCTILVCNSVFLILIMGVRNYFLARTSDTSKISPDCDLQAEAQ